MNIIRHAVQVLGGFVNALRAQFNVGPKELTAELIDNSIDAGADKITIRANETEFEIFDNGIGCADLARFFELGSAQPDQNVRRGRYGTGGTIAALCLADTETVTSVCAGTWRKAVCEWGKAAKQGGMNWCAVGDRKTGEPNGTVIRLEGLKFAFESNRLRAASSYWSFIHTPYLRERGEISLNGLKLQPVPFPKLIERQDFQGRFNGKAYRVAIGVLEREADIEPWKAGFYVSCAGRILNEKGYWDGAEDFAGVPIWGFIELLEGDSADSKWALHLHKTDFAERETFFNYLVPHIEPLLIMAQEIADEREENLHIFEEQSSKLLASVFDAPTGFDKIREKRRHPEEHSGTVEPGSGDYARSNAEKTHPDKPGSVIDIEDRRKRRELEKKPWTIRFKKLGEKQGIGRAIVTKKSATVEFNIDNEYIRARTKTLELVPIALSMIWHDADEIRQSEMWALVFPGREDVFEDPRKREARWMGEALKKFQALLDLKKPMRKRA